jgi:phosphatidylserine decarboxylase
MPEMLKSVLVPIHRAGWPFIAGFVVIDLVLWSMADWLGWLGLLGVAWCIFFFRDPPRVTPVREGLVVSPADGLVQAVEPHMPPAELGMAAVPLMRISVFMNVFDVHVNRVPVDAEVVATSYRPGKFFNASLDKASEFNERQSIRLRVDDGREFAVVQIAGLVARRISCALSHGQPVKAGERFGLIRFGSRLDVYLPEGVAPLVAVGQRTIAGETVLADMASREAARPGEVR